MVVGQNLVILVFSVPACLKNYPFIYIYHPSRFLTIIIYNKILLMIKNSKRAFLLAGLAVTVLSCQKEDEPIDLEAPQVSMQVSGRPEKLFNDVTVTASVTDNDSVSRVEFYLGETFLNEDLEEPFEVIWNTKDAAEGMHLLKAVAFDATGNTGESVKEVTVKNTLLIVNVEDGYLQTEEHQEEDFWLYLSDKNGNIVGEPKQIKNGESLKWIRPANFNSDTIYLNRFAYYAYSNPASKASRYLNLYTYTNFSLDEVNYLSTANAPSPALLGEATVTITNDFDGSESYGYETNLGTSQMGSVTPLSSTQHRVKVHEGQTKGFTSYETPHSWELSARERHFIYHDIKAGQDHPFHTNDFQPMRKKSVSIPFEYDVVKSYSEAYKDVIGDDSFHMLDLLFLFNSESDFLNIFYADWLLW